MSGKEKLLLVLITLAVVGFSLSQRKDLIILSKEIRNKMEQIEPKREALEILSITQKRLSRVRKRFEISSNVSLQQIVYNASKKCNMKILMVVPKKKSPYMCLLDESLSVGLEGTYDGLLCFVSNIEQIKNRGFLYIAGLSIPKRSERDGNTASKGESQYYMEVEVHRLSVSLSQK